MHEAETTTVPTLAADSKTFELPSRRPPARDGDAIMATQREQRHRLLPFQPNFGQPIVDPKAPRQAVKEWKKQLKRMRRAWMPGPRANAERAAAAAAKASTNTAAR